jgi:glutaredoxin|tara:strand:+ start:949 stop:1272 length:324 start_codon:yes stop_codon:yes gene_type:complete
MNKNNPQIKRLLEDLQTNNNKNLVLYSIAGCPACEEFKTKLGKLDITYESIDMENNDDMWTKLNQMGGSEYVPQITIDGNLVKEYKDVNELLSMTISEIIDRKVILK